jgi:voltage-gated potassium channel
MFTSLRQKVYRILDPKEGAGRWHDLVNAFIICLIILNTLAVLTETIDGFYQRHLKIFLSFEIFSVAIFTIEYILRLWTIPERKAYSAPVRGRIKYLFSPGALIDLLAIAPFYLPAALFLDLRFIRIFRLLRFVRFFKLSRYRHASNIIKRVFKNKKEELVLSFMLSFFLIIFSASLMYFIEHDAQPVKFSSIPETMWWSVATLTTSGFRDVYPITIAGKILSSCISILGIGMFALPAGIFASGFSEEFKHSKTKKHCPACGTELDN